LDDDNRQRNQNLPLHFIPFTAEFREVAEVLANVKVCKYAMMTVL
jgi:hypothetical protein